jgi:nicotinamide-nucleotide amidase
VVKDSSTALQGDIDVLVAKLADLLREHGQMIATAESCTGGLISAACTGLAGSSDWFERGFVTYSNEAKVEQLGVDAALIDAKGAVSEVVARAMAFGAVRHSRAQAGVAVTGIAGPGGGSPEKPVGTVWFGFSADGLLSSEMKVFPGDRAAVRMATVHHALQRLLQLLRASHGLSD